MWRAVTNQGRQHWVSKVAMATTPAILLFYDYNNRPYPGHPCVCETNFEHHNKNDVDGGQFGRSASSNSNNGHGTRSAVNCRSRCDLAWVKNHGDSTQAECSVVRHSSPQNVHPQKRHEDSTRRAVRFTNTDTNNNAGNKFDPVYSKFFEVKLTSSSSLSSDGDADGDASPADANDATIQEGSDDDGASVVEKTPSLSSSTSSDAAPAPLLHNTIVVLPDLLTAEECELIVLDAERILRDQNKMSKGVKTEKWTMYSHFSPASQRIIDTLLQDHVLTFIKRRLPNVAKRIFDGLDTGTLLLNESGTDTTAEYPTGSVPNMDNNSSNIDGFYHWDDPVVIKYIAGNQLAPHEDMRELTIVVPLNPLGDEDTMKFPLVGGGTRFWLEGTSPESATNNGGVSIKPSPGSGIIFNGDITHSGNSVHQGTRFVLMTSICVDEDCDYDVDNDCEE